jgi:exo-1,4-beta-D-glucosaminidase
MLRELPPVQVEAAGGPMRAEGNDTVIQITLKNPSPYLAFFLQVALLKGPEGGEVAPSYWSDNDVSLLPGEEKNLRVKFAAVDLEGRKPMVRVRGWNVAPGLVEVPD